MFVIRLTYQCLMDELEAKLAAHREFLDKNYEAGLFIASGPQKPRVGGVILASNKVSRNEIDEIISEDPFFIHSLAIYEVIEFTPSKFAPPLEGVL